MTKNKKAPELKTYVICYGTPSPRAVLIGQSATEPVVGQPITMQDARMVLYWAPECGGLYGLCANGPRGNSRLTASVPQYAVTPVEWGELTPEAAAAVAAWVAA